MRERIKKKLGLIVGTCALMMASMTISVFAAGNPFVDVAKTAYYYKPVEWAVEKEVTSGRTPTTFCPTEDCTRGQVVTFLWRAAGSPEMTSEENPFSDVDKVNNASYYQAILWAKKNNITNGYDDGTFQPGRTVTRAEFVTLQYRAAGSPSVDASENPFADVDANQHNNFKDAIIWAYKNNITLGKDASHFLPDAVCSRANVVAFLYRERALNCYAFADAYAKVVSVYSESAKYTLYDVDGDYIPELIINKDKNTYFVYTYDRYGIDFWGEVYSKYNECLYEYEGNGFYLHDYDIENFQSLYLYNKDTVKSKNPEMKIDTKTDTYENFQQYLSGLTPINKFYSMTDYSYLYSY